MSIYQVKYQWTGPSSPLYTYHYFDAAGGTAQQAATATVNFWTSMMANINSAYAIVLDTEVRTLNEANGDLQAITSVTSASVTGGSGGVLLDLLQGMLTWRTATVMDGRLLRGRTFIPGIEEGRNAAGGLPEASFKTAIDGYAFTLINDTNSVLVVWHRPREDHPTLPDRDGDFAAVTAGALDTNWSYLKSRRVG